MAGGMQGDRFDSTIELIQILQRESAQYFKKLESLSSYSCSGSELRDELQHLQQLTKQLKANLEASGLSAVPGDLDLMDSQAFIKRAREDTDNSRMTLHRIQSNCKMLVQAMAKK